MMLTALFDILSGLKAGDSFGGFLLLTV